MLNSRTIYSKISGTCSETDIIGHKCAYVTSVFEKKIVFKVSKIKKRQVWCNLQVTLCDPYLSALSVRYFNKSTI